MQVFSQAAVTGSIGGRYYNTEPVIHYTLGGGLDGARNVSVKLPPMTARFLKVELLFAAQWILISEISFRSGQFLETDK